MRYPVHPPRHLLSPPAEQVVPMLASNFEVLKNRLPANIDVEFLASRYRESTTVARLLWEHPIDSRLPRYLHRLRMPTLVVWGDEDKIIPVQQAQLWRGHIPNAEVMIVMCAGHLVHLAKPAYVPASGTF